jgi:hypothetical protein
MWFDPILQRFARTFPNVELRYRTRLESFEATANRVSPDIVDLASGSESLSKPIICAMALIAWCAARSASGSMARHWGIQ